jgi:Putative MetA-pathway of phenol degradation
MSSPHGACRETNVLCRLFKLTAVLAACLCCLSRTAQAQGGPPYYTNDPGTPGNKQWEINLGYMPFLYNGHSVTHTPDVDINFGLGDRIQLTYENAWLRGWDPESGSRYGLGQDQLGVKWRFYDNEKTGFAISTFPQLSLNNPNDSVKRGITPPGASLILPVEFSKKLGWVDLNWEVGYNFVHLGGDGYLAGIVAGHDFTKKLELDAEFYAIGTFHPAKNSDTLGIGARYKIHPPFVLLLMAGRSVEGANRGQPYFVGYFGMQFLLPPRPFDVNHVTASIADLNSVAHGVQF